MSLFIKLHTGTDHWHEWRQGEPIPVNIGQVVTFQADGDELEMILDAMGARWSRINDPLGVIAASLVFKDGRRINFSQKALELLSLQDDMEDPQTKTNPLFWMPPSSVEFGELAEPSNH